MKTQFRRTMFVGLMLVLGILLPGSTSIDPLPALAQGPGSAPNKPATTSTGTWILAASMQGERYDHAATLLNDGRVFVVGDYHGMYPAEIYDGSRWYYVKRPSTCSVCQRGVTATLLKDGRVLVVGGVSSDYPIIHTSKCAEVYDPKADSWTRLPDMLYGHAYHTATLLDDGKVLIAGGCAQWGEPDDQGCTATTDQTEVYDPQKNLWSDAGRMSDRRVQATATLLTWNSKVLVAGGWTCGSPCNRTTTASADLYDPYSNTWSPTGNMTRAAFGHTATLLPYQSWVLVAGGADMVYTHTDVQMYEPASGRWYPWGSLREARRSHTATYLPDSNSILVTGGLRSHWTYNDSELWNFTNDPSKSVWVAAGNMSSPREFHTATLLQNGRVLVAGGSDGRGVAQLNSLSSVDLYTPLGECCRIDPGHIPEPILAPGSQDFAITTKY